MKKFIPFTLILLIIGCSEKTAPTDSYSEPAYSKQYRADALTAIISLSETNITSAEKIVFMLEVHTPNNEEPAFPNLGSLIDSFTISDGYTEPQQTLPNGKLLHRRVWTLVPALPGNYTFQPLEISAAQNSIKTEPIRIEVQSLIPEGTNELEIRDIAEPIELLPAQQQKRRSIYMVFGAVLVLSTLGALFYVLRKPRPEIIILSHEAAFQALENLPDHPVERIHELNRIFRAYHETRFGIPMVGKTAAELGPVLDDTQMIRFLENCDTVRFSNQVPDGFAQEAEQYVRNHIETTREVAE